MKKIIKNIKANYKLVISVLIAGMFLGWLLTGSPDNPPAAEQKSNDHVGHDPASSGETTTWTCSMHPQIKQEKPGDCPICGMDLVPLSTMESTGDEVNSGEIRMTEAAAKLADIRTTVVRKGTPEKTVFLQGKVRVDERNIAELTARFGGRIEKLSVSFTGEYVKKGEPLGTLYSPELVTAQRELIEASAFRESRPAIYQAAREKLKLWDLTGEQIAGIEQQGAPKRYFDVLAPISGTVMKRHVSAGDYVKTGEVLFQVVDLSRVWVLFDAYETDLPWIKTGDPVAMNLPSLPGNTYQGKVSFIDPFIDEQTRTSQVRVELQNSGMKLKPGMFVNGMLRSTAADAETLLIPKSSVLWTGKRSVVYVKVPGSDSPVFQYREITLGAEAGDHYTVAEGLRAGEMVATNGVFKIDAAAQLEGKSSMMNPPEGSGTSGHHEGMEMNTSRRETSFKVGGNCGMCKDRIEKAALSVEGVHSAEWDAETQTIRLGYAGNGALDEVHRAIAEAGHDTEKMKAPDDVYEDLPACCLYERFDYSGEKQKAEKVMVQVAGNCGMCKDRIEKAALSVEGVHSAEWDAETQMVALEYHPERTSSEAIQKAIAEAGHDTEQYKAPMEVYEKLPECCKYARE